MAALTLVWCPFVSLKDHFIELIAFSIYILHTHENKIVGHDDIPTTQIIIALVSTWTSC
jgi:hypothetical protein